MPSQVKAVNQVLSSEAGCSSSSADDPATHIDPRQRCCWQGTHFFNAIMAIITRLMFILHSMLAMWRVVSSTSNDHWWLAVLVLGIMIETMVVLIKRRGVEWKWFQWSVFLYLISVIPSIWILELQKTDRFQNELANKTFLAFEINVASTNLAPMSMKTDDWVTLLEQSILVIIIASRWLLPKGDLTRDQLSSLLLIHLGTASDIIDFLTILTETQVAESSSFTYVILTFWSWSFMQFPFVVTAKADDSKKLEEELNDLELEVDGIEAKKNIFKRFRAKMRTVIETEIWGVLVSVLMQDGPFAIIRLTAILGYGIVTYSNLFFACKNVMVLILQLYRIISLYLEHKEAERARRKVITLRLKHLYGRP